MSRVTGRVLQQLFILCLIVLGAQVRQTAAQEIPSTPITAATAGQVSKYAFLGDGEVMRGGWSANGEYIAITSGIHIYLYDRDLTLLRTLSNQIGYEEAVLSPDGSLIAITDRNGRVEIRDSFGDDIYFSMTIEKTRSRRALAFSPDGSKLAIISGNSVLIWSSTADAPLDRLMHNAKVNDAVFIPNAPAGTIWLATAAEDGGLRIWDVEQKRAISAHSLPFSPVRVVVSPDGHWIATATINPGEHLFVQALQNGILDPKEFRLHEESNRQSTFRYPSNTIFRAGIAFSADSQRLYFLNNYTWWALTTTATGIEWQQKYTDGFYDNLRDIAPSPDGTSVLYIAKTIAVLRDLTDDSDQSILELPLNLSSFGFSTNGDALYIMRSHVRGIPYVERYPLLPQVEFEPDTVMNCSADSPIAECFTAIPDIVTETPFHCRFALFSPNRRYEVTCINFRFESIRLVDRNSGERTLVISNPTAVPQFSPDSSVLAVATESSRPGFLPDAYAVTLFDTETGQILNVLDDFESAVSKIGFSPDGSLLATQSGNRGVLLWRYDDLIPPSIPLNSVNR